MVALTHTPMNRQRLEIIENTSDLRIMRLVLSSFPTNAYIVACPQTGHSALIDVPPGGPTIVKHLKGTTLRCMLLTHNHIDHIGGLAATRARVMAPLAVHASDNKRWLPFPPEIVLKDGDSIRVGNVSIRARHTPGHTPGSMCFKIGDYLMSGDTMYAGGPGGTASPTDFRRIVESIGSRIMVLPDETRICPGHGEPTVLKKEKAEFAVFSSRPHDPNLCGDVTWLSS